MGKSLVQQLREAADWCAGRQTHTPYSDADYVRLFRDASDEIEGHQNVEMLKSSCSL